MTDTLTSRLSFFGRIADDLSREPVPSRNYRIGLEQPWLEASYRSDDYFVFPDLKVSAQAYRFRLESSRYQARHFQQSLPTATSVELAFDGEDEFVLTITAVNVASNQVTFDNVPFLPQIRRGSAVLGEAGFLGALKEDLGGVDVGSASLVSVVGLSAGGLLRIVRSRSLVAKPGPYYPFPPGTTLLAIRVVEDGPAEPPVPLVRTMLKKVNGLTLGATSVAGLQLHHVTLPAGQRVMLGQDKDLESVSDDRGNIVLYFAGHLLITSLEVELALLGYAPKTVQLPITAAKRNSVTLKLVPN
jgi:hypothetical protein